MGAATFNLHYRQETKPLNIGTGPLILSLANPGHKRRLSAILADTRVIEELQVLLWVPLQASCQVRVVA